VVINKTDEKHLEKIVHQVGFIDKIVREFVNKRGRSRDSGGI